jgi:hypothetical protein
LLRLLVMIQVRSNDLNLEIYRMILAFTVTRMAFTGNV